MSAQILKRAASPVPLSCILHIIAILFLAMLGGSYIGTESPEIETVVELAPDIAEEQQVTPEARPEQVIDNSFTAQIALEVAENIVQKAAMADSTGNQALLSSDMAAVNGDGAVANGNGSSTAAYGGSSTSGSTDGENYSSTSNAGSQSAGSSGSAATESIGSIASRFARRVESNKEYPYMAMKRNQQGVVTVYATISAGGSLLDSGIAGSSGVSSLDKAALAAVRSSCPFEHGAGDTITITVPIHFYLQ